MVWLGLFLQLNNPVAGVARHFGNRAVAVFARVRYPEFMASRAACFAGRIELSLHEGDTTVLIHQQHRG